MRLKLWALFALALFGWFAVPTQSQAFFFRFGFGCGSGGGCGVQVGCVPCGQGGQVWAGSGVPVQGGYGRTTTVYPQSGGCLNGLCPAPIGGGVVNPPRIPPQNIPEPAPKPKELPKPKDLPKTEEESAKRQIDDFYLSFNRPNERTVTRLEKSESLPLEAKPEFRGTRILTDWEGGIWPGDNKFYPKGSFRYIKEITPAPESEPVYQTQGFPYPSTGANRSWVVYPNQGNYPTLLSPPMYRVGGCANGNCPR